MEGVSLELAKSSTLREPREDSITKHDSHRLGISRCLRIVKPQAAKNGQASRSSCHLSASHRVLDLVVHRPDMPVLPGNLMNLPYLGLALWKDPQSPACLELILVIAGASLYSCTGVQQERYRQTLAGMPRSRRYRRRR